MYSSISLNSARGFTLLEVLVSLVIVGGAMAGLTMVSQSYTESSQRSLVAHQVRTLGDAAKGYISDNYAAVQAVATPTSPALIDVATLIAGGHLTTGFANTNGFNQSMCVLVLEPVANRLQAMVVAENGTVLDDLSLGELASTIGGSGGAVYSDDATAIKGALGGWRIPVTTFDNLTNNVNRRCDGTAGNVRIVSGRPTMALWFENGGTSNDFLSRSQIPGRPELNEMSAPLVMNSVQTVSGACTQVGAIARDAVGAMVSCQGGQWKSAGGSAYWSDPVSTAALLPPCNAAATGQARMVMNPAVGSGARGYTCSGTAWIALAVDNLGVLNVPQKITGGGADLTYGALTVQGEKSGWGGANFRSASGTNQGTLMMHPSYSGFYNAADSNWRWYADDPGNTWQGGSANTSDVLIRSIGRYASQIFGGAFSTNIYVGCYIGNPRAGGACGCPGGFGAYPTGQFSVYAGSDSNAYVCQQ